LTDYATIKKRCAEDPEYREKYLAMRRANNQKARDRAKAKLTQAEIDERKRQGEARRIAAVRAANERKYGPKQPATEPEFKQRKPGRLLALCGWNKWR